MGAAQSQAILRARLIALLAALIVGTFGAYAAMPALFRMVPTDLSRIAVLLRALRDPGLSPSLVLLGNSQAMCGLDGRRLSGALPGDPVALNLASTGQSLEESFLFYQELPASVGTIVQMLSARALSGGFTLGAQKFNAFYMYGYQPTEHTTRVLTALYGEPARRILQASTLSQRFTARWALRQFVDTGLRRLLRTDLALERATNDLYFPQPYTERISEPKLERLLKRWTSAAGEAPRLAPGKEGLLAAIVKDARAADRELVLVLAPMHPRARLALGNEPLRPAQRHLEALAGGAHVTLVDAIDLLDEDHFIDDVHPTDEGAGILTGRVARAIRDAR